MTTRITRKKNKATTQIEYHILHDEIYWLLKSMHVLFQLHGFFSSLSLVSLLSYLCLPVVSMNLYRRAILEVMQQATTRPFVVRVVVGSDVSKPKFDRNHRLVHVVKCDTISFTPIRNKREYMLAYIILRWRFSAIICNNNYKNNNEMCAHFYLIYFSNEQFLWFDTRQEIAYEARDIKSCRNILVDNNNNISRSKNEPIELIKSAQSGV